MSAPSPALPAGLAAAIAAQLEGRPRQALAERARRLSERYRAGKPTRETILDEADALAYALTRMPATFAATIATIGRLASERPDFAPRRLLDAGCGLGAASYAATAVWPEIEEVALIDRSAAFLSLAAKLSAASGVAQVAGATITAAELTRPAPTRQPPMDLVIAAYAFTELTAEEGAAAAAALWARAAGALVIVEPGSPRDHARLMGVRAQLVGLGATILGPCPHHAPCPIQAPDWCHFSVRLPRSREHRLLKGADAPFEDEKFAYLIAARDGAPLPGRVLAPPRRGKAGISLKLCEKEGIREIFVQKRDKARYEGIRKSNWGDALIPPEDGG